VIVGPTRRVGAGEPELTGRRRNRRHLVSGQIGTGGQISLETRTKVPVRGAETLQLIEQRVARSGGAPPAKRGGNTALGESTRPLVDRIDGGIVSQTAIFGAPLWYPWHAARLQSAPPKHLRSCDRV